MVLYLYKIRRKNMNIKVNNVQELYDDVCALYNHEIEGNGRNISRGYCNRKYGKGTY